MTTNFEINADKIQDFANFINPIITADADKRKQFVISSKSKAPNGAMRILCDSADFFVGYLRTHGAIESVDGRFC